jgi:hypothetical protein
MSTSYIYGSLQRLASTTDRVNRLNRPPGRHRCNDAIERTKKSPATRSTAEGRDIEQSRTIANRVKVTIGSNTLNEPRDQGAGPWQHNRQCQCDHRYEQQEWKCYCSHHAGSGQDADSAIVAIRHGQQENRKSGTTGSTRKQESTVSR